MTYNVANLLTLSRIAAIPLLIGLLYIDGDAGAIAAFVVFVLAGITDWLDGYIARAWEEQSEFGRFLDPIADKLLVAATLMVLVAERRIEGWAVLAALIILCREILVSGLREFLAGLSVSVPVSKLAKWKTAIQFTALAILILGDAGPSWLYGRSLGVVGLCFAAALTIITGYDYLRAGLRYMAGDEQPAIKREDAEAPLKSPARSAG
jgi:cardiolipin synthase